jgi:glycosyltransferase involved in cell wall biosynthesis
VCIRLVADLSVGTGVRPKVAPHVQRHSGEDRRAFDVEFCCDAVRVALGVTPFSVVAIIAAFNEADIIGQVVGDLVGQGIGVYILDHGSTDGTVAALEPYLGHGVLAVERFGIETPEGQFDLAGIIRRKEALAHEISADWFINHDADEFRESPWSHLSLRDAIRLVDALGYNAIDFQLLNFWPTHDDFHPGADVRRSFHLFEHGQPWDRVQIRAWKKPAAPVDLVSTAGHDAQFPGRRVFPIRFLLRHYPIRGQAHGERKVFRERLPRFSRAERSRGWHIQYDDIHEGECFLRDARTLTPYDPDLVRFELWLRHRGVEELEQTVHDLGGETERLRVELTARVNEIALRAAETDRIRCDLATQAAEVEGLRVALVRRAHEYKALQQRFEERDIEVTGLREAVRDLRRRLDEVYASKSWQWMAPLRAAYRSLRGR